MLDGTAEVSRARPTTALLIEWFSASSGAFSAGLCVGRSLAQSVAVVCYAEVKDITADGMVKDGWVKDNQFGLVGRVLL
jgi:hypothetical protein